MATSPVTPVLDTLHAEPGGYGQPSFADFYAALAEAVYQQAASGGSPPTLLVMGEPLAGKSTFLSQLFVRLGAKDEGHGTEDEESRAKDEGIRPYLVRWGDTIRAAKKLGDVAQERQFGDLTPEEFERTSRRLAEAAAAAQEAARGGPPALVVVEAPGVTMLTEDGRRRGLDRGYTLAQKLAVDERGFLLVLCADQQVRDANLGSREAQLATGGPTVREATQLAANRIRQQVTDLLFDLVTEGKLQLPARQGTAPVTRADLDADPAYRNDAVRRVYLPYLFQHDLHVPSDRSFIGLNSYLGSGVAPDMALLDRFDWTHQHFDL